MTDKSFQKKRSINATMDKITPPSTEKLKVLNEPKYRGSKINATADEIFDGNRFKKVGAFDRATKFYGTPEEKKLEKERAKEGKEDFSDFMYKPDPDKKAPGYLEKGVKVRGAYIQRKKVFIWIGVAVAALLCLLIFLPPIMISKAEDTAVDHNANVFENMGMTEFKTYALANYSVYNEEAFSSERAENYRVVILTAHLQNSSPFEVKIDQYKAVGVPKKYRDRLCYVTSTHVDQNGKVVGDVVPGFSDLDVQIEIMVNVADMTDKQFDELITGLTIRTVGAKKRLLGGKYVPTIPAYLFVSNNVNVGIDP
ncbi:MAG: hypothetical protein IJ737_07070 [Ruminococcus sp.]|nr:hypothetical protein [Ruminococcus sp.]